jgi:hypothetical protein
MSIDRENLSYEVGDEQMTDARLDTGLAANLMILVLLIHASSKRYKLNLLSNLRWVPQIYLELQFYPSVWTVL